MKLKSGILSAATVAFTLTIGAAGPAMTAGFGDGLSAYRNGNPAAAWRVFMPLAEQGDVQAQNMLGWMYSLGNDGWPEDNQQAANWFQKAAAQGSSSAQYNLGRMYADGEGVRRNYRQAARWFTEAAGQGNQRAQLQLAKLYELGAGVPKDPREAMSLWVSLAESGWPAAQFEVAKMYRKGERVGKDLVQSYKWASLAAKNPQYLAAKVLLEILAGKMTAGQVAEARRQVSQWQPKRKPSQRALNEIVYQFGGEPGSDGEVRLFFTPSTR